MKLLVALLATLYLFCLVQDVQSFSFPSIADLFGYGDDESDSVESADASNSSDSDEICFGEIGCFKKRLYVQEDTIPSSGFFTPSNPDDLDISLIYFNDLDDKGDTYRYNSTKIKDFKIGLKTFILIHGWQSGFEYESWIDDLKDTVLSISKNKKANVFVVDWSKEASSIVYPKSAADTLSVGASIGYFIIKTLIKNYQLNPKDVHIIGHSLGGQTSGFVGQYTKKHNYTIGRITALDAAGPFFRDTNDTERVDETDADFVEALHTNAAGFILGGFGTLLKSGTVDYWPNGGTTQTGCDLRDSLGDVVKNGLLQAVNAPSCSHVRAPQIYSVNYDRDATCQLIAYQCKDYDSFLKGECADCGKDLSKCRFVGLSAKYDSSKAPIPKDRDMKFFMKTTEKAPFCQHTYQIKLTTSKKLDKTATGSIYVNLIGHKRDAKDIKITSPISGFAANTTYTVLVEKDLTLERIEKVQLYYYQPVKLIDMIVAPNLQVYVQKVEVNYMSHIDPEVRRNNSGIFVPSNPGFHEISKNAKDRTTFARLKA